MNRSPEPADASLQSLLSIRARPVGAILEALASLRQAATETKDPERVPLTTLMLRSGHSVSGWLLSREQPGGQGHLFLLHTPQQSARDVVAVDAEDIVAVTVHNAPTFAESL